MMECAAKRVFGRALGERDKMLDWLYGGFSIIEFVVFGVTYRHEVMG